MNSDLSKTQSFFELYDLRRSDALDGKRAHVVTFGCQQNEADSERLRGMLATMGCSLAERAEDADVILLNTCAIREHAEMKALSLLGRFKALRKSNPELIIGVLGCMAAEPRRVDMLKRDFHYVDFTLPPSEIHKLPAVIAEVVQNRKRTFVPYVSEPRIVEDIPVSRTSTFKSWVSVMYGCNNFCTYCIVPYVRGRERSRDSAAVIKECRELVAAGTKEITLLGQNVNSYSSDLTFAELISEIARIEGDFIIRFMTSHPKDVSPELIEAIRRYKGKIAPYFHLPLQSGSDKILRSMNRTYTKEKYLETVRALRAAVPEIALSTDVIIGFPGEEDGDFLETLDVLSTVRFDMVYAFLYSPRNGTRAALMENRVERSVMDARMAKLIEMQNEISLECNLPFVGKRVRVLVESSDEKDGAVVYTGRTPDARLVHFKSCDAELGEFADVLIERAGISCLYGK